MQALFAFDPLLLEAHSARPESASGKRNLYCRIRQNAGVIGVATSVTQNSEPKTALDPPRTLVRLAPVQRSCSDLSGAAETISIENRLDVRHWRYSICRDQAFWRMAFFPPVCKGRRAWWENRRRLVSQARSTIGASGGFGRAHFREEEAVAVAPVPLCVIHGHVGIGLQHIHILAIARVDADADASRYVQLLAVDEKWPR